MLAKLDILYTKSLSAWITPIMPLNTINSLIRSILTLSFYILILASLVALFLLAHFLKAKVFLKVSMFMLNWLAFLLWSLRKEAMFFQP